MKRMLSVFLLSALCLSLLAAGCGKKEDATPSEDASRLAPHYDASFSILPCDGGIAGAAMADGRLYYVTRIEGERMETVYTCLPDGSDRRELTALTAFLREEEQDGSSYSFQGLASGGNGQLMLLGSRSSMDSEDTALRLTVDLEGRVLVGHPCSEDLSIAWQNFPCAADRDGTAYFTAYDCFLLLDADGVEQTVRPGAGERPIGVAVMKEGPFALLKNDKDGVNLRPIDPVRAALGEVRAVLPLPHDVLGIDLYFYPGSGEYDLYCSAGLSLYGYKLGDRVTCGQVLSWVNCDVDGNSLLCFDTMENGDLLCATWSDPLGGGLSVLRKNESGGGERTVLTLACRGDSAEIAPLVIRFNRTNAQYRVEVRDYDAYNPGAGLTAGLDRLTTEIITGRAPDLMCTSGMDLDAFIRLGLLEDLWPWIDGDEKLGGRDALVQPVFDALSRDGKLYEAAPGFEVYTLFALNEVVGDLPGLTWEQFWQRYEAMGEGVRVLNAYGDRKRAMEFNLMPFYLGQMIRGDVFRREEYTNFLRLAALFPDPARNISQWDVSSLLGSRKLMLSWSGYINDPVRYRNAQEAFGALDHIPMGFPGLPGNGSAFGVYLPVAMTAASPNKEGAWAFLRSILSAEGQVLNTYAHRNPAFPTSKPVYDELIRTSTIDQVEQTGHITSTRNAVWTDEDADRFWELVSGVETVRRSLPQVETILYEEAARYFDGGQTLEQAVSAAESRVGLYLNERK